MEVDDSMFMEGNASLNDTLQRDADEIREEALKNVIEDTQEQQRNQNGQAFATSILDARIALLATAIGGPDYSNTSEADGSIPTNYKHGDDCLACLKDLKKWFKLVDDNQRKYEVAMACAKYKILLDDLIPILLDWEIKNKNYNKYIKNEKKNSKNVNTTLKKVSPPSPYYNKIALLSLQLMVLMTWPIIMNDDSSSNQILHYNELKKNQLTYKKNILSSNVIKPIVRIAIQKISIDKKSRTSKDYQIIKLVMQLLRNVLAIEPFQMVLTTEKLSRLRTKTKSFNESSPLPHNVTLEDINLSTTLTAFNDAKVFPMVLTLSNSLNKEFDADFLNQILMEFFFYFIKDLSPETLLGNTLNENHHSLEQNDKFKKPSSNINHTSTSKNLSQGSQLGDLLSKEKELKKNVVRNTSTRHSRFGSLISIQTPDNGRFTISGGNAKDLIERDSILDKLDQRKKWDKATIFKDNESVDGLQSNFLNFTKSSSSANLNTLIKKSLLENFVHFIDSDSFNILIKSVTDFYINNEESMSIINQIQYLIFYTWFIKFQTIRTFDHNVKISLTEIESRIAHIDYILNDKLIIFITKLLRDSMENKLWSVVHASIISYTELLNLLYHLDDFYSEDSKYIKEKLFSDDRINILCLLPRIANKHSIGFIKSTIDLTHIILKTLDKNSDLTLKNHKLLNKHNNNLNGEKGDKILKLRSTIARKLAKIKETENISDDDEAMEIYEDQLMSRKINVEQILQKYFNDETVKTYIGFLKKYKNLDYHDLKRTLQFLHRLFISQKEESYLFRLDFIVLLKEMLSADGLPRNDKLRKHLQSFTDYYLQKLKERLKKSPTWYIDLLFPNLTDKSVGFYSRYGQVQTNFLQNYICCLPSEFKKLPDEEALPASVVLDMKFGILISTLIDGHKDDILQELLEHLKSAVTLIDDMNANGMDLKHIEFQNKQVSDDDKNTTNIVDVHRACRGDPDYRSLLLLIGYVVPVKVVDKCYLPKNIELTQLKLGISMVSKYMNTTFDAPNGMSSSSYLIRFYEDGSQADDRGERNRKSAKLDVDNDDENFLEASGKNSYSDDEDNEFVVRDDEEDQVEHDADYFKDLSNKKMVNEFLKKGKAVSKKSKSAKKKNGSTTNLPLHDITDDESSSKSSKKKSKSTIVSSAMIDDSDDEDDDDQLTNPIFFENEQYMRWILDKHMGSIPEEKMILFGKFTKSRFANKGQVVGDWTSLFDGPVPDISETQSRNPVIKDTLETELATQNKNYSDVDSEENDTSEMEVQSVQAGNQNDNMDAAENILQYTPEHLHEQEMEFSDEEFEGNDEISTTSKRSLNGDTDEEHEDFIPRKKRATDLFLDDDDEDDS